MSVDDRFPRMGEISPIDDLPDVACENKSIVRITRVGRLVAALVNDRLKISALSTINHRRLRVSGSNPATNRMT